MGRVAVLGAGLQGACIALELGQRGIGVDLFDRCAEPMSQASLQNEGKIHLGYTYAKDCSLRTARMMMAGGLSFSPLMTRWAGPEFAEVTVSTPFYYLVHARSLLDAEAIERHLLNIHQLVLEACDAWGGHYFGIDLREAPARLHPTEIDELFNPGTVAGAFRTSEIAIDPVALAVLVRQRIASQDKIQLSMRTTITGVRPAGHGVTVEFKDSVGHSSAFYDHVVNALWESRLAIDLTAGHKPDRPWLHRVKHFLRVGTSSPVSMPSFTIVLGPFGDVVNYGNGYIYLSWYPAGMHGMSKEIQPPDWLPVNSDLVERLKHDIPSGLAGVVPQIANLYHLDLDRAEVQGGHIFAWGHTDIDDENSGLHERHAIGPHSVGRYHSIDTGKLTMAPLFAKKIADRICSSNN
jgi:hypothetical protein